MKLSDEMRFAHPVLSIETDDFGDGEFIFNLSVEERSADNQLRLQCESQVTDPDLEACIAAGTAAVGVFVSCPETYFNQLREVPLGRGTVDFPGGLLRGRVTLRPIIWSTAALTGWKPANIHPEFGTSPLNIDKSKLLGAGDEFVIQVGHEKLAPMESIFNLAKKPELKDGEIELDLEGSRIKILLNEPTFESVGNYRSRGEGKAILLNSVYLPAVMEVVRSLASNRQIYENCRWFKPFIAKCEHLNINLQKHEPLQHAQALMLNPLTRLMGVQEKLLP